MVLPVCAVAENDRFNIVENNLDDDSEWKDKSGLLGLLREINDAKIETIEDDYCVRVNLKNNSLFRYAPRRMSVTERAEVDKIVNDLLERGIIRESISPYCGGCEA